MSEISLTNAELQTAHWALPEGYLMRPATMDDLEAAVRMMNGWARRTIGREKFELKEVGLEWEEPGFNLESDSLLAIAPGGEVAGYFEVFDPGDPHNRIHGWGAVHPDFSDLGIEAALLDWAEGRARRSVPDAPPEVRVAFVTHCFSSQEDYQALLLASGFEFTRHSLRMVIDLEQPPSSPVWPEGITVRQMIVDREELLVIQAVREAFKDHWGYVDRPLEEDLSRWEHFMENSPIFDPSLWFLALEGEQIAGMSLCFPKARDDEQMGWVGTLGVRRQWRRRGIALALLQHSFGEFWRRGKRKVGLGVDAKSLTGATRLYEKAGMRPDETRQVSIFEKELRPGIELSTQSVEV